MDSFNLIAGLCSILSFLLAAYDWSQRNGKRGARRNKHQKGGRADPLTA